MKNKIITFLTLLIFLAIISFVFLSIKGKVYTVRLNNFDFTGYEINDFFTTQTGTSVSLIDKKIENGELILKYRSLEKGRSIIDINNDNYYNYLKLYVNSFGIITYETYFGDANGDEVIPISISILTIVLLIMVIDSFKKSIKKNLYQYKNMYLLGLIIFISFLIIEQILRLFNYGGLHDVVEKYITSYSLLSYVLFPLGFITFIIVGISNIILIKKEGFSILNMLGIILGVFICLLTLVPEIMYRFTYTDFLINIHNQSTIAYHVYTFVETLIFSIVAYLECILVSVIILSIKASRRIPSFNKDYIIILGCMINKDGSLTNLLKSRVDRAIEFRNMQYKETKKDLIFVPSGGKGNDEVISEGEAISKYLISKDIQKNKIIVEDKSTNTYENFKYSLKKIKNSKNVAYSTTNYHVFRAGVEASEFNNSIEGIGAKTKRYFWINAFIREFIATIYYERKRHIIIFSMLLFVYALMLLLLYLSNTL